MNKNLIPLSERSSEELREMRVKGGKKSGETRRKRKSLREAMQIALSLEYTTPEGEKLPGIEALALAVVKRAIESGGTKDYKDLMQICGEDLLSKADAKERDARIQAFNRANNISVDGEDNTGKVVLIAPKEGLEELEQKAIEEAKRRDQERTGRN
jgi:hypothetical protein